MQKYKFLKPALVLLIITVGVTFLLSLVNFITEKKIEENTYRKKLEAIQEIFPSLELFESKSSDSYPSSVSDAGIVKDAEGNTIGYYAEAAPMGLNGNISMIVGIAPDGTIIKTVCLSHSETPGFGTRATDGWYFEQFKSMNTLDSVTTLSGATVSSKAVKLGITEACAAISELMEVKQ